MSERKQIGSSAKRGCYRDWQEVIVRDEVPPLGGLSQYIDRRGIALRVIRTGTWYLVLGGLSQYIDRRGNALRVIRTGTAQRRAEKGFDPSNISQAAFY